MVQLSRCGATDVAEDDGILCARSAPIPNLSVEAPGWPGKTPGPLRDDPAGRACLHGGATYQRSEQPLVDAESCRRPIVCAVHRAKWNGPHRSVRSSESA